MQTKFTHLHIALILTLLITHCQALGPDDLRMTYKQFKDKYSKPTLPPDQQSQREAIFYQNLQVLKTKIQSGCDSCGVTPFFDQTSFEFRTRMGLMPENHQYLNEEYQKLKNVKSAEQIQQYDNLVKVGDVPSSKNWADEGKVTSIKNQGSCGTCWSFATAAAVESSMIIKGQTSNFFFYEPDLSQQFLLTCAKRGTCKGGYLQQSIDLAHSLGIPYESQYPYQARKGDLSICSNTRGNVKFSDGDRARFSYYDINDFQIISLLQQGPLMIAISADDWEYYGGGIFSCKSTAQVNHAVLLVGYDDTKWIVKNQWGVSWGEKGYIYVNRNKLRNCKIGVAVHQLYSPLALWSVAVLLLSLILIF